MRAAAQKANQKQKKATNVKETSTYRKYISTDGHEILCGRNNIQNDQLTFRIANNTDKATNDFETIIVTRKDKNVVIISEEAYNNLLENAYLLKDKANYDWLMESKKQLESGKATVHQLIDEE